MESRFLRLRFENDDQKGNSKSKGMRKTLLEQAEGWWCGGWK